ncbi:MAG: hypothetical protein HY433_02190 [Candidatus Liptonbacteria bacterium]|nr:hypothetical protein [Candidatus Liptonbacteria bacterium]
MWRIYNLCRYLRDFKEIYYFEIGNIQQDYPANGVPLWKFVNYVSERIGKTSKEDRKKLEIEIADLCSQDFFDDEAEGYWVAPSGEIVPDRSFIDLGWKGRKILKWYYLPEFLFKEHPVVAGIAIAVITSPIWLKIWEWIKIIVEQKLNS